MESDIVSHSKMHAYLKIVDGILNGTWEWFFANNENIELQPYKTYFSHALQQRIILTIHFAE